MRERAAEPSDDGERHGRKETDGPYAQVEGDIDVGVGWDLTALDGPVEDCAGLLWSPC